MAVHQHRKGWRGSLTLTTSVYNTKAEAEQALADLKASVQSWRAAQEQPRPLHQPPPLARPAWTLSARPAITPS
jgi:hypothetical protein